jgi:hypothetical protein
MIGGTHQAAAADGEEYDAVDTEGVAQQARAALRALLEASSIVRVVTVDDSNREAADQEIDRDLILTALRNENLTVEALEESDTTRGIVTDADGDVRDIADLIDDIEVYPPRISDDELKELTNAARLHTKAQQPKAGRDSSKTAPSLTEADEGEDDKPPIVRDLESLTALEALFADTAAFQALTLKQWHQQKDALLADPTPLLILFDRDFQLEGASPTAGDQLIGEILGNHAALHVFCGMITHAATSRDVERQIAGTIVDSFDVDVAEVIVIARDNVRHSPLELVGKIKAAVLARELASLRGLTSAALSSATDAAIGELKTLDSYTLLALVEAAALEGTHDAHNILRVAFTHTRRTLEERMHHDDVTLGPLAQIRKARDITPREILLNRPDDLAQRRHVDSFDDADFLAASNLPLEPGDIFRSVNPEKLLHGQIEEQKAQCILLTQPCDTIMRPTGIRTGSPKMLSVAPLEWIPGPAQRNEKVWDSDFRLDWYEPAREGGHWYVRLAQRTQVPTIYLDACVLNREGVGRITVGASPPATLTPGWLKRHRRLQEWAGGKLSRFSDLTGKNPLTAEVKQLVVASLTGASSELHTVKAAMDPQQQVITFGVRRIARLSDPRTKALLTQAAQHLGRAAEEGALLKEPTSA